jgi:nicotinamidase-related amidase
MAKVEVPDYEIRDSLDIVPLRTALLVMDMQKDFVEDGGALLVPDARDTVKPIKRLVDAFHSQDILVVYTQDSHREGDPEFDIWGHHVLEGTAGEGIIDELGPMEGDIVVKKARYDAFYGTDLDQILRSRDIDSIVVVGTVANICVHYTTASAAQRWYGLICPVDCISALTEFDMHVHLHQTAYLFQGILTTSDAILNCLNKAS